MARRDRGLGHGFGRLWTASIASNLADGLARTAVPLIATTLTKDPLLIAGIGALSFLPWLLFGVLSGVVVDRVDRRRAMALANIVRVLAALAVTLSITMGSLTIWTLYICILAFGIGETVYDNSTIAMVPSIVGKAGLDRSNSRMQASDLVVQNFVATPIASVLFVAAMALPMISTAAGFLVSAVLAMTLPLVAGRAVRDEPRISSTTKGDLHEAFSFLRHSRFLRSMVIVTSLNGIFFSLGQASIVLFILDTLDVPEAGFGLVTAGVGVGALIGAVVASPLIARFRRGRVLLAGSLLAGLGILATGFAPNVWIAVTVYAVSAFGISIWNVPWGALRQDIIPGHLLGRLIGIIRTLTWGMFPIATLIGGLIARIDLRLPLIVGGAGAILVSLVASRLLLSADTYGAPPNVGGAA